MDVLIKVLSRSIVGVLMPGLLGCGCLFPSAPYSPNLYAALRAEAEDLRESGKYRQAIVKYEQAFKNRPRPPVDTKVINVNYLTLFKYSIAHCYIRLAEAEDDDSLYIKAEEEARESYETAIIPSDQVNALYLWGYTLFKQARYEEARVKFETTIETALQRDSRDVFTKEALFALGKTYMALGDKVAARRAFAQFEEQLEKDAKAGSVFYPGFSYVDLSVENRVFGFNSDVFYEETLYTLGKTHLELGDDAAARRTFERLLKEIDIAGQKGYISVYNRLYSDAFYEKTLYAVMKIYLELSDKATALGNTYFALSDKTTARRAFVLLLEHFPDSSYKPEVERLLEKQ